MRAGLWPVDHRKRLDKLFLQVKLAKVFVVTLALFVVTYTPCMNKVICVLFKRPSVAWAVLLPVWSLNNIEGPWKPCIKYI